MLDSDSKLFPGMILLASACGGASTPAPSSASRESSHESATDVANAASDEEAATAAAVPERAACDDGTCSPCGDALCPLGWYCDETAPGGPSCGWLPECAQKSGCACVKKALGCACEEKAGGAHVSCG